MVLARLPLVLATLAGVTGSPISHKQGSLVQTWNSALDQGRDTPVTRVVNLLKDMSKTLQSEMKEDEDLYHKLACWCNNNQYEKDNAIEAATTKISDLKSSIESLTAKKAELALTIKELESSVAADKQSLAEATELRNKQLSEFHKEEGDSVQAVENLKAAITVLSKHHSAPPDSTVAGGAIFKSEKDSWSLLSVKTKKFPWNSNSMERPLDDFMRQNGFSDVEVPRPAAGRAAQKFLQQGGATMATDADSSQEWSTSDSALVQNALKSAAAFVQAHHSEGYNPAYTAQSGEIMGVLQQLKEEMEGDLSDSQKREMDRAATFAELRKAKMSEIESGEKMAEQKEDESANTGTALADAKQDLVKTEDSLTADQKFMKNLKETCAEADTNFETRKAARLEEIKAVSETIEILQADKARDAMSGTYNFLQVSGQDSRRHAAAAALRQAASKLHQPQLSILATSVELDAFTKVKKAIDEMIVALKQQQSDEVKKTDWCNAEFQENEMATARTSDEKSSLEAKAEELESNIKSLEDGMAEAHRQIAQLQLELQRATEDRKVENHDFQKTMADQTTTVEVLHKALDKLATYYDLAQTQATGRRQTPPVAQKEYAPNQGASSVMEMIEKLIHEAHGLMSDSKHSESQAQAAYEQLIADTNDSVQALQKEVVFKTKEHAQANKDKMQVESDLKDTVKELDGLAKYELDLHKDCDYVLKNFDVRQSARGQEIEALRQVKQILSGASFD